MTMNNNSSNNDLTLPNEGEVGSQFRNLRISIDEDWDNERFETDGAALMRFNSRMPSGSLTTLFSTATPTSVVSEEDQEEFQYELPPHELEQEDLDDFPIYEGVLSLELTEQEIAELDSLQDVESAVSENDSEYERQAWEAWYASEDDSDIDSEYETYEHFRRDTLLRRQNFTSLVVAASMGEGGYDPTIFNMLEARVQAHINEHLDDESDYDSVHSYNTDSDATVRTVEEDSDSDGTFYVPHHVDVFIRPQAGEFNYQNQEYDQNQSAEQAYAHGMHWQRQFLKPIAKQAVIDALPNFAPFNDMIGKALQGASKGENLGKFFNCAYATYRLYEKLSYSTSISNVTGSLLETYIMITGNRISDMVETPAFVYECFNIQHETMVEQQAGVFGSVISCWKSLANSTIASKLKKLATMIAALGITNVLGVDLSSGMFGKIWGIVEPFLKQTDIFAQVCECIEVIYNKCAQAFTTKSWAPLADGCDMRYIDGRVADLAIVYEKHMSGQIKDDDMDLLAACAEALALTDVCKRFGGLAETKSQRTAFASQQAKVGIMHTALAAKMTEKAVVHAPYVVTLISGPGMGKSANVTPIMYELQHALNLPVGPEYSYTIQPDDKFMTGYTNQPIIIMDDVANATPATCTVNPCSQIIGYINNAKKVAPKAHLDEKGKSLIVASGFIITGNDVTMNAVSFARTPEAIMRRLGDIITIKVKPEYCVPGGEMLDTSLDILQLRYDVWIVSVTKYNTLTKSFDPVHDDDGPLTDVGMPRVYRYIGKAAIKHRTGQNRLIRQIEEMRTMERCEHHTYADICDICYEERRLPPVAEDEDMLEVNLQAGYFTTASSLLALAINRNHIMTHMRYAGMKITDYIVVSITLVLIIMFVEYKYMGHIGLASALVVCSTAYSFYLIYKEVVEFCKLIVQSANFGAIADKARDSILGKHAQSIGLAVGAVGLILGSWQIYTQSQELKKKDRQLLNSEMAHDDTMWDLLEKIREYEELSGRYRELARIKLESQGSVASYPKRPEIAHKDIWHNVHIERKFTAPLNPHTTGDQLAGVMTSGLTIVYFHTTEVCDNGATCMSMPLCTYNTLVPTHILGICEEKGYKYMTIQRGDTNTHNGSNTILIEGAYSHIPGTDYSIMYAPSIRDQKNIVKFFPKRSLLPSGELKLHNEACRVSYVKPVDKIDDEGRKYKSLARYEAGVNVRSTNVNVMGMPTLWGGIYDFPENTYNGACGAVIVTEGPDSCIGGLHCAGIEGMRSARFNTLYQEDIQAVLDKMTGPDTAKMQGAERTVFDLDYDKFPFKEGIPDKPHPVLFTPGEFAILGSHTGQIRTNRSAVIESPISQTVTELTGDERKHGAPVYLNDWSPSAVWLDATGHAKQFSMKSIDEATGDYIKGMISVLDKHPEWKEEIMIVPDPVVINGFDGVKGYGALNFNASIGLPECRPKKEFLVDTDQVIPGITCNRTYNADIMKKYHDMEAQLKTGVRVYSPFRINVKDEATKLTSAKVRIFSGGENSLLMLLRKYFLSASAFMQKHMELFESAVGANCYGRDWDRLKAHITKFGTKRIIAGDYSKFDQYVINAITLASFKILIALCMWAGYDAEDLIVMQGLATEVCNPIYEMNGVWLTLGSSTASGHSLTVVINGLNNCIYMRMAYYGLRPVKWKKPFKDCVALMTYGDDNVMSVSEECDWFNHTAIQKWFGGYGITYTMAEKDEASVPFIDIDDATFLKRRWVWDDDMKIHRCPLEKQSIFKMLHTVQKSKVVTVEQQVGDILQTANREFFQHGKQEFESMQKVLLEIASRHELMHYLPNSHLDTYEELQQWMLE